MEQELLLAGLWAELPDWPLAGAQPASVLRIGRYLERQGLLERDAENSYLASDVLEAGPMEQLLVSSSTDRIAVRAQGVCPADATCLR